jgi:AraC-like DNA-binding protein
MIAHDSDARLKSTVSRPWPWPAALRRPPATVDLALHRIHPRIRIAHLRPGQALGRRLIVDHELILTLAGRADVGVGRAWHRVGAGDVIYLQPFTDHRAIDLGDPGSRHLAIHFDWAAGIPDDDAAPQHRTPYRIRPVGWEHPAACLRQVRDLAAAMQAAAHAFAADDPWRAWEASRRLAEGLASLLRTGSRNEDGDARLATLLARLSDDLAFPWDGSSIARAAGLSPSHCRTWFRAATGLSPLDWLRRARIDRARELLRDTQLPIQAIAAQVGFADPLHFSRVFRRMDGRTPSSLRP